MLYPDAERVLCTRIGSYRFGSLPFVKESQKRAKREREIESFIHERLDCVRYFTIIDFCKCYDPGRYT